MEIKWIMIMATVSFLAMFVAIGVGEYGKNQCQIEGIKAGLTDTAIVKICGKSR